MGGTAVAESASDEEEHFTKEKIRYQDCILGKVGAPTEKKQKYLFQILTILCSVPITFTINWALHNPTDVSWVNFSKSLWLIPVTLGVVLGARFLIGNPLVDRLVRTFVAPHLEGLKKALCLPAVNILLMSPIIASLKSLLVEGNLSAVSSTAYLASLPETFLVSFTLSYFVISPFMKKLFIEKIDPLMQGESLSRRISRTLLKLRAFLRAGLRSGHTRTRDSATIGHRLANFSHRRINHQHA